MVIVLNAAAENMTLNFQRFYDSNTESLITTNACSMA